jgi:hypothetical protein
MIDRWRPIRQIDLRIKCRVSAFHLVVWVFVIKGKISLEQKTAIESIRLDHNCKYKLIVTNSKELSDTLQKI